MTELDTRSLACARSLANRLEFDETIICLEKRFVFVFCVCVLVSKEEIIRLFARR